MGSLDYSYEYLDWSHDDIGEGFAHSGLLYSNVFNPAFTIGLSDYINLTISQSIGIRKMDYKGIQATPHHRDEDSKSDFICHKKSRSVHYCKVLILLHHINTKR